MRGSLYILWLSLVVGRDGGVFFLSFAPPRNTAGPTEPVRIGSWIEPAGSGSSVPNWPSGLFQPLVRGVTGLDWSGMLSFDNTDSHEENYPVMPEKHWFGKRPLFPLCLKNINIVVGEPLEFDLSTLQQRAESASRVLIAGGNGYNEENRVHLDSSGWPMGLCKGLDEIAQKWLFVHLSDHIRNAMQNLCVKARSLNNSDHK